ncbi:hypothetical protein Trco_002310 [Trichoderma cornu-damae]|uniref:Uncharacterized protein n=1 Tax=Trichoderma cornu-damae TaxID=654480 RepID=A0A9P8TZ04_9HYPO|nr:hypothetical protein Trco_002310 [Trichoderma cornu-damae]
MAGAEYEYSPFMFWYPPAVCYHQRFGHGTDEDDAGDGAPADGNGISPAAEGSGSGDCGADGPKTTSRLLSLPVEVRLRIFYWAYMMSPVQPKELAVGYPIPMLCRYVLHPLDPDLEKQVEMEVQNEQTVKELAEGDESGEGGHKWQKMKTEQGTKNLIKERTRQRIRELNKTATGMLSSERPLAGVPTGLLRSCRQVYFEARTLPFEHNEFVFLNWFSSGLNAAAAVVKSQRPWQRLAMRYVRLEIMAEDLTRTAALEKWAALCGRGRRPASGLRGLRGLRLKIVAQVGRKDEDAKTAGDGFADGLEEAGGARRWVDGARLADVESLERLEIEIIKKAWGSQEKMDWCAAVQEALRDNGSKAQVVSVARICRKRGVAAHRREAMPAPGFTE